MAMFLLTALAVVLIDQLTKYWAVSTLELDHPVPLIPGMLYLTLTHNTGIAFGMFQDRGWLTIPFTLIVVGGIGYYYWRFRPKRIVAMLLGLLLGGALGNFIDRLRLGYVIDMIDLGWWPVFNVADMAITLSLVGLVAMQFFVKEPAPTPTVEPTEETRQ